jgi:hypothetical protein
MTIDTILSSLVMLAVGVGGAGAQPARLAIGARGVLRLANGEPANDIPGAGLFAHYRLSERWNLALTIDRAEYDFEQPAKLAGIEQDPDLEPIDALAESTVIGVAVERTYPQAGGRATWFWGVGAGVASIDVPDAIGRRRDGGEFHIRTEVGTQLVASLTAGWRRNLGEHWLLDLALGVDQHFADWQLTDTRSGARGAVDDYLTYGAQLGIGYRF